MSGSTHPAATLPGDASIESPTQPSEPFFTPPTYTMKEIHDAIPPHCFQRNTLLSLFYILRDLLSISILFGLATHIPFLPTPALRVGVWIAYSVIQGLLFTGIWELAHECGHGALSPYKVFNNMAGLLIHSLLLVPYHSWRFTHSTHHKSTNNIERDVAFVPDIKEVWLAAREARIPKNLFTYWDLIEDMPLVNLLILIGHQVVAWPLYLILNNLALPRMRAVKWWKRSHFYFGGDGPNFKLEDRDDIILSNFGVGIVGAALWAACRYFGASNVFLFYGAPWLWTNHWILTITFLQHTDPALPYYSTKSWTFLRGAASAVDRDFGFIGHVLFHGVLENHVLHHHASRIPFYNAYEASQAIKRVMGDHYKCDTQTPLLWAFWKNYNRCRYVEEKDTGSSVYFFAQTMENRG